MTKREHPSIQRSRRGSRTAAAAPRARRLPGRRIASLRRTDRASRPDVAGGRGSRRRRHRRPEDVPGARQRAARP
ncbi:hypothetical protein PhiBP823_14 [Burkholderia phage PhiBP82.3]|nr:hypothetical protein PhiBP823_14 [Burkholderia phage PhiBP82.3]